MDLMSQLEMDCESNYMHLLYICMLTIYLYKLLLHFSNVEQPCYKACCCVTESCMCAVQSRDNDPFHQVMAKDESMFVP